MCTICIYYIPTIYYTIYTHMEHRHESDDPHRVLHTSSVSSSLSTVGSFWLDSLTVAVCKRGQRERKGDDGGRDWQRKEVKTSLNLEHTYAHTHTHTYTHMHMPTYTYMHASTITYTHTHSTHACTHTCTHTHTGCIPSWRSPLSTEDPLMEPQYSPQSCSHTGRQ